jgi:hypothetical protein
MTLPMRSRCKAFLTVVGSAAGVGFTATITACAPGGFFAKAQHNKNQRGYNAAAHYNFLPHT